MTLRKTLLTLHLYLGLIGAVFLAILGITGSLIAFETELPHWLHRNLFYVTPGPRLVPEQDVVHAAETQLTGAKAQAVQWSRGADGSRVVQMTGGMRVFVNPYDGKVLGAVKGQFASETWLGYVHQVHLRLTPDPRSMPKVAALGKTLVSFAGLVLCLLVPTGLILFWKTRRTTVKWNASWFRVCFDLHHVMGAYASVFLFVAALTGVLIGFELGEKAIFALTHSERPGRIPEVHSAAAGEISQAIGPDRAVEIARVALPGTSVAGYFLPRQPKDAYTVLLRVPEETSETVHSSVAVDQFSGRVLQVRDFRVDSPGYMWVRFNRSVHTGDVWGTPTHILMSLSSLLLVAMVVTGVVIWWRKLAV